MKKLLFALILISVLIFSVSFSFSGRRQNTKYQKCIKKCEKERQECMDMTNGNFPACERGYNRCINMCIAAYKRRR